MRELFNALHATLKCQPVSNAAGRGGGDRQMFYRLLLLGCIASSLAFAARAQSPTADTPIPSENTLDNWLRSGDPRLEAWAAHDALVTRNQNLLPDVLALAEKWQSLERQDCTGLPAPCQELSSEQMDEQDAMAEVLDTLIQLKASVSSEALRNLAPDFGDYVAILLPRLPDQEYIPLALDFYRSPKQYSALQYISAALMALHPPYGFAGNLLASIRVNAFVAVFIPGFEGFGFGDGVGCGSPATESRPDWPRIGHYGFFRDSNSHSFKVIGGIDPVYAERSEYVRYYENQCPGSNSIYLSAGDRKLLIAEMLGTSPGAMAWDTTASTKIQFESAKQIDAAISIFVNDLEAKYRATARALIDKGLMGYPDIESSLPELDIVLMDERGPMAIPIPQPQNLPANVKWSSSR